MDKNEIKKALYKENPVANFSRIVGGNAFYVANIKSKSELVAFMIPVADMGDATFEAEMPAKLLIRYIVDYTSNN